MINAYQLSVISKYNLKPIAENVFSFFSFILLKGQQKDSYALFFNQKLMEWNFFTAQNLALIDKEMGDNNLTAPEHEIVKRIIYHTGDFNYKSLINFSPTAIKSAASALVSRASVIVDVPMVQAGVFNPLEKTFANPVYCLQEINPSSFQKNKKSWALQTLLKHYPGAICVIGEDQLMLNNLLDLLEAQKIQPSLVIATPPHFTGSKIIKDNFNSSFIPNIYVNHHKGGVNVAVAIFNSLVDLTWLAYEEKFKDNDF